MKSIKESEFPIKFEIHNQVDNPTGVPGGADVIEGGVENPEAAVVAPPVPPANPPGTPTTNPQLDASSSRRTRSQSRLETTGGIESSRRQREGSPNSGNRNLRYVFYIFFGMSCLDDD